MGGRPRVHKETRLLLTCLPDNSLWERRVLLPGFSSAAGARNGSQMRSSGPRSCLPVLVYWRRSYLLLTELGKTSLNVPAIDVSIIKA